MDILGSNDHQHYHYLFWLTDVINSSLFYSLCFENGLFVLELWTEVLPELYFCAYRELSSFFVVGVIIFLLLFLFIFYFLRSNKNSIRNQIKTKEYYKKYSQSIKAVDSYD